MSFQTDLIVRRDTTEDNRWILHAPLIYEDDDYKIIIHEGFDFDFASVPNIPIIANLFPRAGTRSDKPSCLHDALYSCQKLPKKISDNLFDKGLHQEGVAEEKRKAMYFVVDKLGQGAWDRCAKTSHEYQHLVSVTVKSS